MATTIDLQVAATADDAWSYDAGGSFTNSSTVHLLDHSTANVHNWVRFVMGGTPIPSGAIMSNCYLSFNAYANDVGTSQLLISGLDVDDVGDFPNWAASNGYALTTEDITWSAGAWTANNWYNSDNISAIVQEIVDLMGGIATGEHIGFKLYNSSMVVLKRCDSYDEASHIVGIKLHMEFTVASTNKQQVIMIS